MGNQVLQYRNVSIAYDGKTVVKDISFTLKSGEILAIVGESGSGKSTIINAIFSTLTHYGNIVHGDILYQGKSLLRNSLEENRQLYGKEIAMVFQNSEASLHPLYTIEKNLNMVVKNHDVPDKDKMRHKALQILSAMNVQDGMRILKSYPFELSGGLNQRVGIMMAMIMAPRILVCDEPTSALDALAQKQVIDALLSFQKKEHCAILMVSHNMALVRQIADDIAVIYNGQMIEYGKKEEIITSPQHDYTKQLLQAGMKMRMKSYDSHFRS